jgi:hypothetical protein
MPDYSKSVIYTIRTGDKTYVGSTTNMRQRKNKHKSCIWTDGAKYHYKLYQTIRDNGGEWDMKPIKEFPCESKTQLAIEEERIRQEIGADLNTIMCHRTAESYLEPIQCACGCKVGYKWYSKHRRTKRHIEIIEQQNANQDN